MTGLHAPAWVKPENTAVKAASIKGHILYDSTYMKCKVWQSQRQRGPAVASGGGRKWGVAVNGHGVSLRVEGDTFWDQTVVTAAHYDVLCPPICSFTSRAFAYCSQP